MPRPFHANRFVFLLLLSIAGCGDVQKKSSQDDPTAIRHINSQVIVPSSSPLASRLEVESAKLTTFSHRVTAPASVEADPARYARILPPLNGRILRLFVHPGDRVNRGQELLAMDSPDFVGAQADYRRAPSALAQAERTITVSPGSKTRLWLLPPVGAEPTSSGGSTVIAGAARTPLLRPFTLDT